MNIIYVIFEQEKETNFFHIPNNFKLLKQYILEEWDYLEEEGLIIEDINHNKITNENDYLIFKKKNKTEKLILYIKYNGKYQKKQDLLINQIVNKINSDNQINWNSNQSNIKNQNINNNNILETIENLDKKVENFKNEIEKIKNNQINLNNGINNLKILINESKENLNKIKNMN